MKHRIILPTVYLSLLCAGQSYAAPAPISTDKAAESALPEKPAEPAKLEKAAKNSITAGMVAPDFALPSQDGLSVSPKDFAGKWVVLYFYPKNFTGGCTLQAHNFQRDSAAYAQANAVVLGVSLDSRDSHQRFCTKEGLSFKLLADTTGEVSARYGSLRSILGKKLSARNTFVIDPEGKVARVFLDVKPAKHSEEVLAALAGFRKP